MKIISHVAAQPGWWLLAPGRNEDLERVPIIAWCMVSVTLDGDHREVATDAYPICAEWVSGIFALQSPDGRITLEGQPFDEAELLAYFRSRDIPARP